MTLDKAIEHAKEVARTCDDSQCAKDHERLAKWLEELKLARESMFSEILQMAQTIHENHELEAENAKLRELVKGLRYCSTEAKGLCARVPIGGTEPSECCPLYDFKTNEYRCEKLMRELGIEEDE